ncbi:MAG: nuclear transport factor 2 family protein [Ideonella sp.]|jgi:uncharacterized protein (TIGR02246 family)|nr:nuclear transport factor 2 family protein [Ideonella sp.]
MALRAPPSVLAATPDELEQQFYEALQQADLDRMMRLWADDEHVHCVHPGGPRLAGPAEVRAGFAALFDRGPVDVHPQTVRRVVAEGAAVHSVLERVNVPTERGPRSAWVFATNVYLRTEQGWRLVCHHASPGGADKPGDAIDAPSVLH